MVEKWRYFPYMDQVLNNGSEVAQSEYSNKVNTDGVPQQSGRHFLNCSLFIITLHEHAQAGVM